jgi:hypothetical protein
MLAEIYGYPNLKDFDADMKAYVEHREKEAKYQEEQKAQALDAEWKYTLRLDSEHFALFTTCDKTTAEAVLQMADDLYEKFWLEFVDTRLFMPAKIKVYMFNRQEEYAGYQKSQGITVKQGDQLIPHFNPWAGAVCVFKGGHGRDYLFQTTAHEIAHALSLSLMSSFWKTGSWVVEGIAHYVGLSASPKSEELDFGEIHETDKSEMTGFLRAMIREGRVRPLREFINLSSEEMRQDFLRTTVQCWSLFHFLQHAENGKYRDGFHRYLAEICAGRDGDAAFEKHVGKLTEMEPEYSKYIRQLRPDTKSR